MRAKPRIFFRCDNRIDGLIVTDDWYDLQEKIDEQLETFLNPSTFEQNKSKNFAISFIDRAEKLIEKNSDTIALLAELRDKSQDPDYWRVIMQTIKLVILALRAGYIPDMAQTTVKEKRRQSLKGSRPRTRNGITPTERLERNKEILSHYEQTHLSISGFANKHAAKYTLQPRQIRNILKKALGS